MRTRRGKAPKSLLPRGDRLRVRAESKRAGIDPAYTAPRARNLPLEAFTASAGEGEEERRGRADIEREIDRSETSADACNFTERGREGKRRRRVELELLAAMAALHLR
jgi:hypothetical protein